VQTHETKEEKGMSYPIHQYRIANASYIVDLFHQARPKSEWWRFMPYCGLTHKIVKEILR